MKLSPLSSLKKTTVLGGNSKGQCTISKILFPLLLYTFTEQNTFFAYPISEQKITVWVSVTQQQKLHLFSSLLESGIQAKKTDIQL